MLFISSQYLYTSCQTYKQEAVCILYEIVTKYLKQFLSHLIEFQICNYKSTLIFLNNVQTLTRMINFNSRIYLLTLGLAFL